MMRMFRFYLYSVVLFALIFFYNSYFQGNFLALFLQVSSPLIISTFLVFLGKNTFISSNSWLKKVYAYLLFFTISIFSYLGFTEGITGSHAASPNPLIYGLSFYTAYLAYFIYNRDISPKEIFIAANPIVLISGPMPVIFKPIVSSFSSRVRYYFPFIVIGFFFFKVISAPMTYYLVMLENTNPVYILIFAVLFRVFLYFNFAGISLMAYGAMGIIGVKIPLNFTQPFSSRSVIEFWRSWHVALSSVLKVLFYDPVKSLSNNTSMALITVYIASAAWHGVSINFFYWGALHAFAFIISIRLLQRNYHFLAGLILLIAIPFGDIFFTDSDITRLSIKMINFLSIDNYILPNFREATGAILAIPKYVLAATGVGLSIVAIEFFGYHTKIVGKKNYKFLRTKLSQTIIFLLILLLVSGQGIEYAAYGQR
jgi:alginate O-acetyltransferase complex protein AlgI